MGRILLGVDSCRSGWATRFGWAMCAGARMGSRAAEFLAGMGGVEFNSKSGAVSPSAYAVTAALLRRPLSARLRGRASCCGARLCQIGRSLACAALGQDKIRVC